MNPVDEMQRSGTGGTEGCSYIYTSCILELTPSMPGINKWALGTLVCTIMRHVLFF